jgi:tetratricopeptide (TPR) repeat protein
VLARADEAGATHLAAVGRYRVARLLDLTGESRPALDELAAVHHEAEAHGWTELAIVSGVYVVYLHAAVFKDFQAALDWEPHVGSTIQRAGDEPHHRAALLDNVGVALLYASRHEDALANHERALELRGIADDPLAEIGTLGNLGIVLEEMGRYAEAIARQERALDLSMAELGEAHPHTARVLDNLGTAHLRNGDLAIARERMERALQIRRSVLGDRHRSVALSRLHLGLAALTAGAPAEALDHYAAASSIYAEVPGGGAHEALLVHEGLAHTHAALRQWPEALAAAERALAGLAPRLPPGHPEIVGLEDIVERAQRAIADEATSAARRGSDVDRVP